MTETTCDQCNKPMKPVTTGFYVRNNARACASGMTSTSEPITLDLCSWRCVEEYARERAA